MMVQIFYVPSWSALFFRNLFFTLFYLKFIEPLLLSQKIRKRLFLLLVIFSAFVVSNHWYNSYFGNYLSLVDVFAGEGTGQFSMFKVLFTQIFKYWDLIFILDLVLLVVTGFLRIPDFQLIKPWEHLQLSFKWFSFKNYTAYILIVLALVFQIAAGSLIMGAESPVELYQKGSNYLVSVYGVLPLYTMEAYSYLNRGQKKPEPELDDIPYYKSQNQLSQKKKLSGQPNVIVIQVESLDEKIIDYRQQGKEVTPFLNDLKKESLYFNNFYAQKVNGSFDADLSTLTSLYPANRSYVFRDVNLTYFNSLPLLLKDKGYRTLAFHNNDRNFFNRGEAFPDLGFGHFYSQRNFREEIYSIPEDKGLGINDYDFFNQAADIIEKANSDQKPFFAFLISLTSHTPFNFYPETAAENFAEVENNFVNNYYKSINFLDQSLNNFVNKLEKEGVLDNTILVVYADHESEIKTTEYNSGRDFTLWKNVKVPYHIPLFIKHPDLKAKISEREGTTTDIAPTILDLLGFEELPEQFVGSSLFLEDEYPILFLHETPHLLKDGQLFIKELDELVKVGHLKDQKKEIKVDSEKMDQINEIIDYMRSIFILNEGGIFEEVE